MHRLCHPDVILYIINIFIKGELNTCKAALAKNTIFTLSTMATADTKEIGDA